MCFFFMLRKETLVHICIHLKSHLLFALLSWCVYTHRKKRSNDPKEELPWLHRRIGKITGWQEGSTGHTWSTLQLLMSKCEEWFGQAWPNTAIWGCCQLRGVRAAPGFFGTREKNIKREPALVLSCLTLHHFMTARCWQYLFPPLQRQGQHFEKVSNSKINVHMQICWEVMQSVKWKQI